jgi:hypothetical protein
MAVEAFIVALRNGWEIFIKKFILVLGRENDVTSN